MRILQVIPVFSAPFGGPVTVVRSISKELAKRHDVTVYTTTALDHKHDLKNSQFEITSDGYRVVYFPRILRFSGFNISPRMVKTLKNTINEYDVIHLHSWRHFQDLIVHHYSKKYNVPYIIQTHGSIPRLQTKRIIKSLYDVLFGYRLVNDASRVIALNRTEVEQYRSMGVRDEKIKIIPNGIDISQYSNLPYKGAFKNNFSIKYDENIILYLGRIHKNKGIDFLIKSFSHFIRTKLHNVRLVIAGPNDNYLDVAKRLVASLGLSKCVLFTGYLTEEEKNSAYIDSTVVVYPSQFEPFGIVSFEAAFFSKPVIVTRGTPMSKIIEKGSYGFTVKYDEYESLSKILEYIILNQTLVSQMGEKWHDYVLKNYSWDVIVNKLENVYEGATN